MAQSRYGTAGTIGSWLAIIGTGLMTIPTIAGLAWHSSWAFRRRNISAEAGQMAFEAFLAQEIELQHPGDLEVRAWELAAQFDRPTAYDASYLAVAEGAGCELRTADGRLVKAVAGSLPWVKMPLVPDWSSGK